MTKILGFLWTLCTFTLFTVRTTSFHIDTARHHYIEKVWSQKNCLSFKPFIIMRVVLTGHGCICTSQELWHRSQEGSLPASIHKTRTRWRCSLLRGIHHCHVQRGGEAMRLLARYLWLRTVFVCDINKQPVVFSLHCLVVDIIFSSRSRRGIQKIAGNAAQHDSTSPASRAPFESLPLSKWCSWRWPTVDGGQQESLKCIEHQ